MRRKLTRRMYLQYTWWEVQEILCVLGAYMLVLVVTVGLIVLLAKLLG